MTTSTALPGEFVSSIPQCDTGDQGSHAGKGFTLSAPKDVFLNKPPSLVGRGWRGGRRGGVGVVGAAGL